MWLVSSAVIMVVFWYNYINQASNGNYLSETVIANKYWAIVSFFILLYSASLILVSIYRLNIRIKQLKQHSNIMALSSTGIEVNIIATLGHVALLVVLFVL